MGVAGSADDIKAAGQELLDSWIETTAKRDASAMHRLLARNITDRCSVAQLEQFLAMDDDSFTYPELEVTEVFLETDDRKKAFIVMELKNEPPPGQAGRIAVAVANQPIPIFLENGRWHIGLVFALVGDGCPFVGETSTQGATESATPPPR